MERTQPRPLLVFSGLSLVALAVRGIYFIELSQIPYFDTVLSVYDHSNFDLGALNFAAGDGLVMSPNNSYSPLYKYFLGSLYFLFGRNFYVIYGLQFTLGALGAVLIFLIGKKLFDVRLLIEQGMAYENLNNAEKALDSFYDALLIQGDHSELNKTWEIITCPLGIGFWQCCTGRGIWKPQPKRVNIFRFRSGCSFILNR